MLDSSIVGCWCFPDEASAVADQAFEQVAGGAAMAPILWWFEVRNVLVVNERRGRIDPPGSAAFLADVARLRIDLDRQADGEMVLALARTHRLTVCDAACLELALRIDAPLATLDRKLAAAARAARVPLIGDEAGGDPTAGEGTMRRSEERILTTHAGSLPRPPELLRLYVRRAAGEAVDPAALAAAGRAALDWVVPQQIAAGIDVGNNGEQQREGFFLHLQHRMSGFGGAWKRHPRGDVVRYPKFMAWMEEQQKRRDAVSNFQPPMAIGEVRYLDPGAIRAECEDFRRALERAERGFVEPFLTAPSPGIVASAMKNAWYASEEAYLEALADALRVEYEAIVEAGFLLQLDCPDLALERHISYQDRPLGDFLSFVERVVRAINRALEKVPRERVRLHVCWGNYEGPHDLDVPLAEIWPLIRGARVGGFVFPFANPRHAHEYHCFEDGGLDDDQILVAGVIDTLTNFVEHPEVVAERIERVARAIGDPRRVLAGTDCGFDTSAGMGRVAEDVVWAKLKALAAGARLASDRLF